MERLSDYNFQQLDNDRIALICVHGTKASYMALLRGAHRIRYAVRDGDYVLLSGSSCIIILPETPFESAQIVAMRCCKLLADIEYELQVVSGIAAQIRLRQLYDDRALVVNIPLSTPVKAPLPEDHGMDTLPYLAFLEGYPAYEVLHLLPYNLACHHRCVPVGTDRGVLTVATCRRLEQEVVLQLQEITRREIFQVRCETSMIDDVLSYWQSMVAV